MTEGGGYTIRSDAGSSTSYSTIIGCGILTAMDAGLLYLHKDTLLVEGFDAIPPMGMSVMFPVAAFGIPALCQLARTPDPNITPHPPHPRVSSPVEILLFTFAFITCGCTLLGAPLSGWITCIMLGVLVTLTLVVPSLFACRLGRMAEDILSLMAVGPHGKEVGGGGEKEYKSSSRVSVCFSALPGIGCILGCWAGACFSVLDWNYMWRDWPRPSWMCSIIGRDIGCLLLILAQCGMLIKYMVVSQKSDGKKSKKGQ